MNLVRSEVGSRPMSQNRDNTAGPKRPSLPDITPIHIQAQIVQQEHISVIRFANLSSMYDSYNDASRSPPSSRYRRDPERYRSHSSYKDHHTTRDAAANAAELTSLLDKCKRLESTLKARDKEIHDLRKERDNLLEDRKRIQQKLAQQEAAHATTLANALASAARSTPTPQPSKYQPPSQPEHLGSSSTETPPTSSSTLSHRTSITSISSLHGLPTYHDEYTAHIQSFEVFMTKTDSLSGAQVVEAVMDLNSEIQQFSASLIEAIHTRFGGKPPAIDPSALTQAKQNTATRLGLPLVHLLSTLDPNKDPSPILQSALQAVLCVIIDRTLSSFCVGFPAKYDALLNRLYEQICSSGKPFSFFIPAETNRTVIEPQPTSSRWRSLTHRYVTTFFDTLEQQAQKDLVDDALRWSTDILTLFGTPIPTDDLRNRWESQLQRIAQAALWIAKATKEQVLSTNFEVITVQVGKEFERKHMVNLFDPHYTGGAKGGDGERVLCTTEVGLMCFSGNGVDERTLVQPVVVLESVVQII